MKMPGMMMQADTRVIPAGKPGRYKAAANLQMAGDWQAKLSFDGSQGKGQTAFPISAK